MRDLLNSQKQHIYYFKPYYFDLKPSYFNTRSQIIPNQESNTQYYQNVCYTAVNTNMVSSYVW